MREKSLVVKGGCIDFNVNRVCDQGHGRVARAVVVSMDEFIVVGYVSDYATFGRRRWTAGGVLTGGWVGSKKRKRKLRDENGDRVSKPASDEPGEVDARWFR